MKRCVRSFIALLAAGLLAATAGGIEFKPGETVEFVVQLPEAFRLMAGAGKLSPAKLARCAVAVPKNFDPAKPWPVLVTNASVEPQWHNNLREMRPFVAPALAAGWVVVAADSDLEVTMKEDTNPLRYAVIKAVLAVLASEWPGSEKWPLAMGGFSGGAKRAAWMAAIITVEHRRPIGVIQLGCNEPTMKDAMENYEAPRREFTEIPVFLSSGNADPVATPEDHRRVKRELEDAGFRHVRLERFAGRHEVHAEHIGQALEWFTTEAAKAAAK